MNEELFKLKGVNQVSCDRYMEFRRKHKGLSQLFDILVSTAGYSLSRVVKECDLIYDAIGFLPYIDGALADELETVFKAKLEDLDKIKKEYEEKLGDLPQRELDLSVREHDLKNRTIDVHLREVNVKAAEVQYEKRVDQEKEELEKIRKEIFSFETPELRDRARMAELYLSKIDTNNQWTEKAVAWSLGAIYSGSQIPDFCKKS